MFPLMRAYTFAHLNQLPVFVTNYHQIKVGPWLRREKSKRNYHGFFAFQKGIGGTLLTQWNLKKWKKGRIISEPNLEILKNETTPGVSFFFSAIPHYSKYFSELVENRKLVIEILWQLISAKNRKKITEHPAPFIGVHIRMGDFRKLIAGEEFGKAGTVRTPGDYFIDVIQSIRKIHGANLPVSIFSDGSESELKEILLLENVSLVTGNNDLVDLFVLSKSKIMVASAGSTFSYWAAFLSEGMVIMHPTYLNLNIRPEASTPGVYYGAFDENSKTLISQIHAIKYDQESENK